MGKADCSFRGVYIRVFAKDGEDIEKIRQSFCGLFPFGIEQEKICIKEHTAEGFEGRKIRILEAALSKRRHMNAFMESLRGKLSLEQHQLLIRQKESRLDDELSFFIRLDKEKLIEKNEYFITDFGNCFHIRISIAAFPAKREAALAVIDKIFKYEPKK